MTRREFHAEMAGDLQVRTLPQACDTSSNLVGGTPPTVAVVAVAKMMITHLPVFRLLSNLISTLCSCDRLVGGDGGNSVGWRPDTTRHLCLGFPFEISMPVSHRRILLSP